MKASQKLRQSCQQLTTITLLLLVTSCANFQPAEVKPWKKGVLAREDMLLTPNPVQQLLEEHVYFSREAASGGNSIGGGGCGCN